MIRFDADQQRWVDRDAEALRARQHTESARQQRRSAKGVLAVLAVCGLAFGAWALGWKDEPGPPDNRSQVVVPDPAGTSQQDSAQAGAGEQPADTAGPTGPSESSPPDGFEIADDPEGFSLAVPKGWERRTEGREGGAQAVFYEEPGRSSQLQVFWVQDSDPYESLQLAETNAEKNENYDRESLDRIDGGDGPAARLEYTYDSDDHGGTRRVIDHRFEAQDGELYALVAYAPDTGDASIEEKARLDTALAFFCPAGMDCGTDGDDGLGGSAGP